MKEEEGLERLRERKEARGHKNKMHNPWNFGEKKIFGVFFFFFFNFWVIR